MLTSQFDHPTEVGPDGKPVPISYTYQYDCARDEHPMRIGSIPEQVFVLTAWRGRGECGWIASTVYESPDGYENEFALTLRGRPELSEGALWWQVDTHEGAGRHLSSGDKRFPHIGQAILGAWSGWLTETLQQIDGWRTADAVYGRQWSQRDHTDREASRP